ncbi:hypothetical protein ABEB36_003578 [Hypothenemus hampei]|uniref:Uncharacterized protein n=1 Tax=Hypothenemus hampei TaxID=57062 RepID=A0ABD1F9N3_HYPHA
MELSKHIIGIQGVLLKCSKEIELDFTKINFKEGNEERILRITTEMKNFLTDKRLSSKELNELVFFLALNTEYKKLLPDINEHSHLKGIIPKLSKYLLATICFQLNLVHQYGYVIECFPLDLIEELLDQVVQCLKCLKRKIHIKCAFIILNSLMRKLTVLQGNTKSEIQDLIDDLVPVVSVILRNLVLVEADRVKGTEMQNVYKEIGLILLNLLQLLLTINNNDPALRKLLNTFITITGDVVKCVTLNIYVSWAEIEYNEDNLQAVISGRGYEVIEKYQELDMASELVGMLKTISRKPKTIAERILEADVASIIKMVNKCDEHQKFWFKALIKKNVFSDEEIVDCLDRWYNLSDIETVEVLLKLRPKTSKHKKLVFKCASVLTLEDLKKVLIFYLYAERWHWNDNIVDQLVPLFNQINGNLTVEKQKDLIELILQNPSQFIQHLFQNAFRHSQELKDIFKLLKEQSEIGLKFLIELFKENPISGQNFSNYIQFINCIIETEFYSWPFLVEQVFLPLIKKSEKNSEELKFLTQIFSNFQHLKCELPMQMILFEYFLCVAAENRCKSFLEFEYLKQEITDCAVMYLSAICDNLQGTIALYESFPSLGAGLQDPWTSYYKALLWENPSAVSLLDHLLPNFHLTQNLEGSKNFANLLKVVFLTFQD